MEDWIKKYKANLEIGGRGESFHSALQLLLHKAPQGGIICETGCARLKNDWGGGLSTLVLGDFCKQFTQYHLFSCDIDNVALQVAKEILDDAGIPPEMTTLVESDSVEFLKNFDQQINFLYLDSMDCPQYDSSESLNLIKSQVHQLREIEAALPKLTAECVVLLDDNGFPNGGKTRLTKFFLKEHGFSLILEGKQSLWQR